MNLPNSNDIVWERIATQHYDSVACVAPSDGYKRVQLGKPLEQGTCAREDGTA